MSDDYLVQVKAQVMTRDDSTGGWVPMGGGGMSVVGLRKRELVEGDDTHSEYLIQGKRIADQSVVLNCVIRKDVQYTKANPTFHHWRTDDKRFGLTFQSNADARAFDKGVRRAVEDLMEGSSESNINELEIGDDDVFMTLNLSIRRKDSSSRSASTASTTTSSPTAQSAQVSPVSGECFAFASPHGEHHYLHRVHYIQNIPQRSGGQHPRNSSPQPRSMSASTKSKSSNESSNGINKDEAWIKMEKNSSTTINKIDVQGSDDGIEVDYSYVQFAHTRPSMHEYSYPHLDSIAKSSTQRQESIKSKADVPMKMSVPSHSKKFGRGKRDKKAARQNRHLLSQRSRCVYCHEMFAHDENPRGNCEDAPDKVAQCIERTSCICCASAMLYHCMADVDGDYRHPCICDSLEDNNCKKWTALAVLSLFVPCLWCYWPLTGCHQCGIGCGCCGGRHKAVST